jgi:DNA-binding XRE family transcriptional regulator
MRNGLYMFRHSKRLSQSEIAEKIGCSRQTYSAIETGARDGTIAFWRKFQTAFNIADADIGGLMRIDTTGTRPTDGGRTESN